MIGGNVRDAKNLLKVRIFAQARTAPVRQNLGAEKQRNQKDGKLKLKAIKMAEFFSVSDFKRFQHYRDSQPKWIKLYGSLLSNYEFTLLPERARYHLIGIYLLAARHDNKIPYDAVWVGSQLSTRGKVDLKTLE